MSIIRDVIFLWHFRRCDT